ncbi:MAG: hypothetical protein O2821_12750 [Chloroflexi bacterium]|nr:hypothetical protein [Chloroflexota bacterium]
MTTTTKLEEGLALDRACLKAWFTMHEAQRQRMRFQRFWHPELFNTKVEPRPQSYATEVFKEVLDSMGYGPDYYDRMANTEANAKADLERVARTHPLWEHFEAIKGLSAYTCGAYVAAAGRIDKAHTIAAHWKGMGLDVLPDGTVPRRIRGKKDVERKIPALPHVTMIGEQIRAQFLRPQGRLSEFYYGFKGAEPPDKQKIYRHKSALRLTQKLLYACLWREHRLAYGLDAPMPYAFDLLKHDLGHYITIQDFYEPQG